LATLPLPLQDYEDALPACCAKKWKADCIITPNGKDFRYSPVQATSPDNFLNGS
jgi:hypothetical protein